MNVGESVRKALEDWDQKETDAALLHACNAVDGTAKKLHPSLGSNARFTRLLRDNYAILGAMCAPGIDLEKTRFPVRVQNPKAAGGKPDIADIIYGIHRCTHGHGDELPDGFELLSDAAAASQMTGMEIKPGKVRLSDRIIFGLLGVAVFSPINMDQRVPDRCHFTFAARVLPINEWWGRASDFIALAATKSLPNVKLDFGEWMDSV